MKFLASVLLIWALAPLSLFAQEKLDALDLYRQGRLADAIKVCQQELEETPRNLESHVVLGWSYIGLKRYQDALTIAQKGLTFSPNEPRLTQITAEADFYLGKIEDALANLEEYVRIRPAGTGRSAQVYWLMGECFISLRQYQNADIALSTALYFDQNKAIWWTRLGYAREMADDLASAREAYSRALRLDPEYGDAQRGKDRVDKKLGGG